MIIKYTNLLTLKTIRNIIKIKGIKYKSSLNKSALLTILNEYENAKIIQRCLRCKLMSENTCPISCEKIKYPFISFKINNKFFYYDFENLIQYFKKTRNFRDPLTRQYITDAKLEYINKLIRYYYGKNTNKVLISDSMIKNTELNIITYCLHDLSVDINSKTEITLDEAYYSLLPRILYYIHILNKNHDKRDTFMILTAFKETINADIRNMDIVLDYINLAIVLNC